MNIYARHTSILNIIKCNRFFDKLHPHHQCANTIAICVTITIFVNLRHYFSQINIWTTTTWSNVWVLMFGILPAVSNLINVGNVPSSIQIRPPIAMKIVVSINSEHSCKVSLWEPFHWSSQL
jgi:hypothetical protein